MHLPLDRTNFQFQVCLSVRVSTRPKKKISKFFFMIRVPTGPKRDFQKFLCLGHSQGQKEIFKNFHGAQEKFYIFFSMFRVLTGHEKFSSFIEKNEFENFLGPREHPNHKNFENFSP